MTKFLRISIICVLVAWGCSEGPKSNNGVNRHHVL